MQPEDEHTPLARLSAKSCKAVPCEGGIWHSTLGAVRQPTVQKFQLRLQGHQDYRSKPGDGGERRQGQWKTGVQGSQATEGKAAAQEISSGEESRVS